MDAIDVIGIIVVGFAAGMAGGLIGIGGGVLFVPGLVIFLDQTQLAAVSTSLVAVVMVSVFGAWRQRAYGNMRLKDGLIVGALSPIGVLVGAALANTVSERTLELSFAALQVYFAFRLAERAGLPSWRPTR